MLGLFSHIERLIPRPNAPQPHVIRILVAAFHLGGAVHPPLSMAELKGGAALPDRVWQRYMACQPAMPRDAVIAWVMRSNRYERPDYGSLRKLEIGPRERCARRALQSSRWIDVAPRLSPMA